MPKLKQRKRRGFRQTFVMVLAVALISGGCAGMSTTTKATLGCGAAGGVIGGLIGLATGRAAKNVLIGSAIGAAVGMGACFAIAHYKSRQVADYDQTKQQTGYEPSAGDQVEISDFNLSPNSASPGQDVAFNAKYYVMTPDADKEVTVTETRAVKVYDQSSGTYTELGSNSNQITITPGTREGNGTIPIDPATPDGRYLIVFAVEHNGNRAEKERQLIIGEGAHASIQY